MVLQLLLAAKSGAVGRVVGRLPDDDRVLAGLEHAGAVGLVLEGVLQLVRLKAGAGSVSAIFTCMMVRVFGP